MTTKNIGRFVVSVELDRVEGPIEYYDAVISEEGKEIKVIKGCFGKKSGEYWGAYLERVARRLEVLHSRKDMLLHNIVCYSENSTSAKVGYEKEWQEAINEAQFITEWISDIVEGKLI